MLLKNGMKDKKVVAKLVRIIKYGMISQFEILQKRTAIKKTTKKLVFQMVWKDKDGHKKIFTRRKNANNTMIKSVISFFKPYILLKERN